MRRLIVSLITPAVFVSCSANADIVSNSTFFSVICKIDSSIGFNWHDGQWKEGAFAPQTYVITKLSPPQHESECLLFIAEKESGDIAYPAPTPNLGFSKGCYLIKTLGEEGSPLARNCSETWIGTKNKSVLRNIDCKQGSLNSDSSFEFQINGEIVLTNTYSPFGLKPSHAGDRDSITLEIGKCAQLS